MKPPWVAAQDVQRSAWTGVPSPANGGSAVYGGNYQANLPEAAAIVTAVTGAQSALACGQSSGAAVAGPASRHGLPDGYVIPADADPVEAQAIRFEIAQLGKPYVWGAAGPDAYDCSGLTMAAWGAAGVRLAHYTVDQFAEGTPVPSAGFMAPGDLVLTPGATGTLAAPGHVGMYIGAGLVLDAADVRLGLIVETYTGFVAGGLSGIRHLA
jgi:cell wall-associated NlpC family hydrolase